MKDSFEAASDDVLHHRSQKSWPIFMDQGVDVPFIKWIAAGRHTSLGDFLDSADLLPGQFFAITSHTTRRQRFVYQGMMRHTRNLIKSGFVSRLPAGMTVQRLIGIGV
jgi:hypothetical protein